MNKLIVLISLSIFSSCAFAKCVKGTSSLKKDFPIIFKGIVSNYKIKDGGSKKIISFDITPVLLFNGDLPKEKIFHTSYEYLNLKEPLRIYNASSEFIFFVNKVEGNNLILANTSCLENVRETDLY